ncbi:MAG: RNA polymerase sigma-70 factor (ECF subfamily) [Desulforhopalus sp.]
MHKSNMEKYEAFYKKSKDSLFAYLLKMTGDYHLSRDLVQESFSRHLRSYRDIGEKSRSLLYTIARNAAMDTFRKPKVDRLITDGYADPRRNPEQQLDDRQTYERIMVAIQQLPIIDQKLLSLVSGANLSYTEIGLILNISEANVKVKVHRARLRLKEILSNGGE